MSVYLQATVLIIVASVRLDKNIAPRMAQMEASVTTRPF
jgi:hypothetical protein